MKKFTAGFFVIMFVSFFAASTVYAELAKEGSGNYRSGRTAEVTVLKMI